MWTDFPFSDYYGSSVAMWDYSHLGNPQLTLFVGMQIVGFAYGLL